MLNILRVLSVLAIMAVLSAGAFAQAPGGDPGDPVGGGDNGYGIPKSENWSEFTVWGEPGQNYTIRFYELTNKATATNTTFCDFQEEAYENALFHANNLADIQQAETESRHGGWFSPTNPTGHPTFAGGGVLDPVHYWEGKGLQGPHMATVTVTRFFAFARSGNTVPAWCTSYITAGRIQETMVMHVVGPPLTP